MEVFVRMVTASTTASPLEDDGVIGVGRSNGDNLTDAAYLLARVDDK